MTAMGMASVIHNGVHIHLKLNSRRPRLSSPYPSPNWSRPHFFHHHIVSVRTGDQSAPIARFRAIEQDDDLSTSEEKRGDSTPRDGISKVESSPDEAPKKIKGPETYAASVRTVALWVFAAVAFGIGVGFKEGVGKATEFFAGIGYFHMAVVFRLTLILLGTATLQRFEVVNLFLAAILLYSSFKLFSSGEDDTDLSNNFIVKTCQRFIPVTSNYGGNRFFTFQDGVRKVSNILGRPHLYFSQ